MESSLLNKSTILDKKIPSSNGS